MLKFWIKCKLNIKTVSFTLKVCAICLYLLIITGYQYFHLLLSPVWAGWHIENTSPSSVTLQSVGRLQQLTHVFFGTHLSVKMYKKKKHFHLNVSALISLL